MDKPPKWKTLETRTIFRNQWFDVKQEKVQISESLALEGIIVLHFPDWVNIVAFDENDQLILERNYRHGSGQWMIETPSGSVEPEDKNPKAAAERELYEETGYVAGKLIPLGVSVANGQLQDNKIHHFLALDCKLVSRPKPEIEGNVEFWTESFDTALKRIESGEIQNSYIVEGLLRAAMRVRV